jgi:hypothetical protein
LHSIKVQNRDKLKIPPYAYNLGTKPTFGKKMTEEQAKRVQISIHVDEPLREQLEAAAKRAVRSLSGEAAYRLRQSLEAETGSAA